MPPHALCLGLINDRHIDQFKSIRLLFFSFALNRIELQVMLPATSLCQSLSSGELQFRIFKIRFRSNTLCFARRTSLFM